MAAEIALGLAAAFFVANKTLPAEGPSAATAPPVERAFSVAPGSTGAPFAATSWPKGGAPRLVWTGFQVTETGSRVFVQVTRDVEMDVQTIKGGLAVTLKNCRIHMRNNSRTLDTRFFETPVKEVTVHQRRSSVELDIALKEPASATPRKEAGPGGSQFWVLEFAPPASARGPAVEPSPARASAHDRKPATASRE